MKITGLDGNKTLFSFNMVYFQKFLLIKAISCKTRGFNG